MLDLSHAVFDLVDRIAAAATVQDVWDAYLGVTEQFGLGYAVACYVPNRPEAAVQIIANALPEGCLEAYISKEIWTGDPVLRRARSGTSSFFWKLSDWDPSQAAPAQLLWRDHCTAFDIGGGFCVLDFLPGEEMVLIVCGRDGVELGSHDRLALFFAGREAIHRLHDITASNPASRIGLSQRERECLQWAAAGKTDWEIGRILSLSEKTVNVYIDRAKSKFGVKSRAQAIILASKGGLISN